MKAARQDGLVEGLAEGLARGREEGILQMARNMKQQGLSLDIIQRVTGLSADVCESL